MSKRKSDDACPCQSGKPYANCCAPLHAGAPAPSAEALMRSRYTAYARGDEAYLLSTWHADSRPPNIDFDPALKWIGLAVLRHEQQDADQALVEFVARYRVGGRAGRMQEVSRFVRVDGRWFYCAADHSAA